mmetsp:Transcript_127451/g.407590  ORF Transcript_127451/g.407590 Transcript_127451/m.407590 type:complete len:285 (-) Transcript_127451:656-1510(-)
MHLVQHSHTRGEAALAADVQALDWADPLHLVSRPHRRRSTKITLKRRSSVDSADVQALNWADPLHLVDQGLRQDHTVRRHGHARLTLHAPYAADQQHASMPDPLPVWQALVPMRAHVVERCQCVAGRARTGAVVALLQLELSEVDMRLRDERILTGRAPQELDLQARAHGGGVRDDLPVQVSRLLLGLVRELGGAVLEDPGHHVQVLPDASAHAGDPVERNLRLHHPRVEHGGRLVAVHVAPQVDLDELVQVVRDGDDHYLGDLPCSDVAVLGVHKRVQRHARF